MTNRTAIAIQTAIDFSAMWDLAHPNQKELARDKRNALRRFWWRSWDSVARVNARPNKRWRDIHPEKYDAPVQDKLDCMAAICGSLYNRQYAVVQICQTLDFSESICYQAVARWRAETLDYRWMVCSMRGDLSHRALRDLVLGYPGAC